MTKRRSAHAVDRQAKATHSRALARPELGQPTTPRAPAVGVTSMAVKVQDAETRRIIDEALAKLGGGGV
ncbi:MAG: hypothetical protein Q7S17_10020 [Xanthobacteraceae bacterium]|nr:hypothetical protein [Xanthobacteraceae bacterium]